MKDEFNPLKNKGLAEIRQRVLASGISEPPIWRKGPRQTIRRGETCFIVSFETDWPNVSVIPAMVRGIDLIGRLYIVSIKGRLRTVASERIFETRVAAEAEAQVHAAVNWNCYEAEIDTANEAKWKKHELNEEF